MLHISTATLSKMSELYDQVSKRLKSIRTTAVIIFYMMQYGDSYTVDVTEESIHDVFKNVEKKVHNIVYRPTLVVDWYRGTCKTLLSTVSNFHGEDLSTI